MSGSTAGWRIEDEDLHEAARDFRYLLNRGYPRKTALELVGNRYRLSFDERQLLHRGVFSGADSEGRRKRKVSLRDVARRALGIDGYNVLITLEAGLSGRPLVIADDWFVRDISRVSGNFRRTERTDQALQWVFEALKKANPRQILFLFDSPISRSGKLAEEVRRRLDEEGLPGGAEAVKVPEKILIGFPGIVATSDTAIIDRSEKVLDLAGDILRKRVKRDAFLRLKRKA